MTSAPLPSHLVLLDFPVWLGARQRERHEELMREFQLLLISEGRAETDVDVPRRLIDLVTTLMNRFAALLETSARQRDHALDRRADTAELHYPVVRETGEAVAAWTAMMDEVDEFCRQGELLTLAPAPELVELRHWMVGEFQRQLRGEEPRPWSGPLA